MKVLSIKKLTDLKWINLYELEYLKDDAPEGTPPGTWVFASRKNLTEPNSQYPTQADAVVIIPLLKDGRQRKLVTIKEFRIPLGSPEYGFPAGLYNPNEDLKSVVKRELKEETGLKLTKILYYSKKPNVSSAGLSDESVTYVVCECTGTVSSDGLEGAEEITTQILDFDGVVNLVNSDHGISAKCLPFLLMFLAIKKIAWPKQLRDQ